MRFLFSWFVCSSAALSADIEDHLKKIVDKSGLHSMRNIDFIYMINLDERPEKFHSCMERLSRYGIIPHRFSAINGWNLSIEAINELGVKFEPWMNGGTMGTYYLLDGNFKPTHEIVHETGRNYFCHCMSRGAIGIVLSHLSVIQDAYDSDYETIWVMEDDVEFLNDPHLLSDLIEQLDAAVGKDQWDILFTDQDTKNSYGWYVPCTASAWRPNFTHSNPHRFEERQDINSDFRKIGARFGAYSMIVRRSGMKKLLNFFKNYQIFLPYDMEYVQPFDIRLYTVKKDIVTPQVGAPSDNGGPNYLNQKRETP
jgi:GR25 family glycosyltransferase involved in LPS biosynthesis